MSHSSDALSVANSRNPRPFHGPGKGQCRADPTELTLDSLAPQSPNRGTRVSPNPRMPCTTTGSDNYDLY